MSDTQTITIGEEHEGLRLDVALAALLVDTSRTAAQRLIKEARVSRNGLSVKPKDIVEAGDTLTIAGGATGPERPTAAPENLPLDIIYEDDALLVVNKKAGMTTHPAPGSPGGTLVNALLGRGVTLSGEGGDLRPGIVHRLDKDTSGLLVVAKDAQAHHHLARQLATRALSRRYVALVWGAPRWKRARVDAPIGRHPANRQKMAVVTEGEGRPAITDLDVLEPLGGIALLRARLQSGRTHQIRVHSAYAGHPVAGDPLYGGIRPAQTRQMPPDVAEAIQALPGQALHAAYLGFVHPRTQEAMAFAAPPPPAILRLLSALGSGFDTEGLLAAVRAEPTSMEEQAEGG